MCNFIPFVAEHSALVNSEGEKKSEGRKEERKVKTKKKAAPTATASLQCTALLPACMEDGRRSRA